jgi:hypothetical protein
MYRYAGFLSFCLLFSATLKAQDTLPRFTVATRGPGKILISWHNKFPPITTLNIQRSTDSLKNFTTLISVNDPNLPENGATDTKATNPNFYYRLFIVFETGQYIFTSSRRPQSNAGPTAALARETASRETASRETAAHEPTSRDPVSREEEADIKEIAKAASTRVVFVDPAKMERPTGIRTTGRIHSTAPEISDSAFSATIFVRRGDSTIATITGRQIQSYRDSLLKRTRDTLVFVNGDTLLIKPYIAPEVYKISSYVYTGKYGNIHVTLPQAPRRQYSVKFFDENNKLLFELSEIRDPALILDKANFQHAGWFRFELYDGPQLMEKNKLFIPKEF